MKNKLQLFVSTLFFSLLLCSAGAQSYQANVEFSTTATNINATPGTNIPIQLSINGTPPPYLFPNGSVIVPSAGSFDLTFNLIDITSGSSYQIYKNDIWFYSYDTNSDGSADAWSFFRLLYYPGGTINLNLTSCIPTGQYRLAIGIENLNFASASGVDGIVFDAKAFDFINSVYNHCTDNLPAVPAPPPCNSMVNVMEINFTNSYAPLNVTSNSTPASCGHKDGTAHITSLTGGASPYTFAWNCTPQQTTKDALGLSAGTYICTITDATGCKHYETVTVGGQAVVYDYPNGVNITSGTQTLIDGNGDGKIKIKGLLTVNSGVNYTISGKTLEFNSVDNYLPSTLPASGVVVKDKAKLTVSGGAVLKGLTECANMWDGIEVWGVNISGPVSPANPPGILVINNATIRDAHIAVKNYNKEFSNANATVEATRGNFINNNVGIQLYGYGKNINKNQSFINGCVFTCNAPLLDAATYGGNGSSIFVELGMVSSIKISANSFNGNTAFTAEKRGTAINSYYSGYSVVSTDRIGNTYNVFPVPNRFNNLTKGIDNYSNGSYLEKVTVRNNSFTNTLQGITANGAAFDEISLNTFTIPAGLSTAFASWGLNLYGSKGFLATENTFDAATTNADTYATIVRNNATTAGQLYKNKFAGAFEVATQAEQNNSQLQIKCNTYSGTNTYDWAVTSGAIANQGQCDIFDATSPAGNTFGACGTADESQIFVNPSASGFVYRTQPSLMPTCATAVISAIPCTNPFNPSTSCPAKISNGGNVNALQQLLATATDPTIKGLAKADLIRTLLENNNEHGVDNLLAGSTDPEDIKLLIAKYVSEGNCSAARQKLNSLPQSDAENTSFYQLYDVHTKLCEQNRNISQLSVTEKTTVESIAQTSTQVSANAEALLAAANKMQYARVPEKINHANANRMMQFGENSNPISEGSNIFSIYPNPAGEKAHVIYNTKVDSSIIIYNVLGAKVAEYSLTGTNGSLELNTGSFESGTYFVIMKGAEQSSVVKKLVIQK